MVNFKLLSLSSERNLSHSFHMTMRNMIIKPDSKLIFKLFLLSFYSHSFSFELISTSFLYFPRFFIFFILFGFPKKANDCSYARTQNYNTNYNCSSDQTFTHLLRFYRTIIRKIVFIEDL